MKKSEREKQMTFYAFLQPGKKKQLWGKKGVSKSVEVKR